MRQSLPQSIASSIDEVTNADFDVVRFILPGEQSMEDLVTARDIIAKASIPMDRSEMAQAITKLLVLTKRRAEDQVDLELMVSAYAERLEQFPGDIVAEVLDRWPANSKWWPAWQELEEEIRWRNERAMMKAAIERKIEKLNLEKIKAGKP